MGLSRLLPAHHLAHVLPLEPPSPGRSDLRLEAAKTANGPLRAGDDSGQLDFRRADDHQTPALHAAEFQLIGFSDGRCAARVDSTRDDSLADQSRGGSVGIGNSDVRRLAVYPCSVW